MNEEMYDIIIIGAGTAGLSAAIYAGRAGKKVIVIEEKSYGGQIIVSPEVENYPGIKHISGFEFANKLYEQAVLAGASILTEEVVDIKENEKYKKVITKKNEFNTKSVIVATGVKRRKLGIDNEEKFTGAGISYCATCDGMFYRDRDVVVAGGGNTAIEEVKYLSEICRTVYVVHRRNEFRAEENLVKSIEAKENVHIILNNNITELSGEEFLEKVKIKNVQTEEEQILEVQGVFVAIGQEPKNDIYKELVNTDEYGYIMAGEDCKTNVEGIYAAGDCRTKEVRQLVTAAADGAIAAVMACKLL